MKCNSSKFLLISILTFIVGIGVGQVWQDFTTLFISVKPSQINHLEKQIEETKTQENLSLCEKHKNYKSFSKAKHTVTASRTLNGRSICLAESFYPPSALAVKASGDVKVEVLIDESGDVISAKAISGHPLLRFAAVTSAYKSKFSPNLLGGEIVRVKGILVVNFVLPG